LAADWTSMRRRMDSLMPLVIDRGNRILRRKPGLALG
jgi:hypothetical protein